MDIDLAKTFLEIVRCGSLIAAADRLHVTQTAISARVQKLEHSLNSTLFIRNRKGAKLTADGEAFVIYATQLVQTWETALRDLPLPASFHKVLHIGAEASLCNPLLLSWVFQMQKKIDSHAIKVQIKDGAGLLLQLDLGFLDAVLVFQPVYWPGLQVEQVLEETLILVRVPGKPTPYVYIDWGEEFRKGHDAALPEKARADLSFNVGPVALQYILENGGAGYFRAHLVQAYIDTGVLERVGSAPEFSYATYLVYSRNRCSGELRRAIELLKDVVAAEHESLCPGVR
jgi:DNA-binding transcriptional LysR family regulator